MFALRSPRSEFGFIRSQCPSILTTRTNSTKFDLIVYLFPYLPSALALFPYALFAVQSCTPGRQSYLTRLESREGDDVTVTFYALALCHIPVRAGVPAVDHLRLLPVYERPPKHRQLAERHRGRQTRRNASSSQPAGSRDATTHALVWPGPLDGCVGTPTTNATPPTVLATSQNCASVRRFDLRRN